MAALELREFLDQQGVAWERLILGGFSQGAMVTAEILRQGLVDPSMPLPAVALLFSGALVAESWWAAVPAVPADRSLPPVFQSHGTHDPVLPLSEGQALRDVLATVGFSVTWQEFEGRHEIPQTVVDAAAAALPPLG
jgi:phospholipase/carboxylesterase